MRHARRARRFKINLVAWVVGSALLAWLWVRHERGAYGPFERIGNNGNPGDWNPTLLVVGVGLWALVVGIMGLRVLFERPVSVAEAGDERQRLRLERARRLRFHLAAWVWGMLVLAPIWLSVEWQDNGRFRHWSSNGERGDWDPWILSVAGGWALGIVILALWLRLDPRRHSLIDRSER